VNNDTTSLPITNTFRGYNAWVRFEDGLESPVRVINARSEMKFSDGTAGPAIKVRFGTRYLVGAGHRYETSYSLTGYWIKASRLFKK
jgi:hypothetical protein